MCTCQQVTGRTAQRKHVFEVVDTVNSCTPNDLLQLASISNLEDKSGNNCMYMSNVSVSALLKAQYLQMLCDPFPCVKVSTNKD